MTTLGYVGIGPSHLASGDVICILDNATIPFVLRPRPDGQSGYLVVGEAYVQGIMDGEYLERVRSQEVAQRTFFALY